MKYKIIEFALACITCLFATFSTKAYLEKDSLPYQDLVFVNDFGFLFLKLPFSVSTTQYAVDLSQLAALNQ